MIDFPSDPVIGQEYVYETRVWRYNGVGWKALSSAPVDIRKKRHDFVAPYSYCGVAPRTAISESSPEWRITRVEILEDGSTSIAIAENVAWNDRLTVQYN